MLSEWMKPSPNPGVIAWLDRQQTDQLYLCAVTKAEIETGIAMLSKGRRREALRHAAELVFAEFAGRCLPFDCALASIYGDILARSKQLGRPMSAEAAQIATVARGNSLQLATRNTTDFDFLAELDVVNPWAG